jgi:hypothetical protein
MGMPPIAACPNHCWFSRLPPAQFGGISRVKLIPFHNIVPGAIGTTMAGARGDRDSPIERLAAGPSPVPIRPLIGVIMPTTALQTSGCG